jgi:hypothetical protein
MAELKAVAIEGFDPAKDKVVRWRRIDLREELARSLPVTMSERTVGKWLGRLEMARLQPRPVHPEKRMRWRRETLKVSAAWPESPIAPKNGPVA